MEPVSGTFFTETPAVWVGLGLASAYFDIAKADSQIPSAYFSIADSALAWTCRLSGLDFFFEAQSQPC